MALDVSTAERRAVVPVAVSSVLLLSLYAIVLLPGPAIDWVMPEERPVELLGAVALAVGSVLCVLIWRRARHWSPVARLSLLVLAVLLFFGAGEEESWGQRWFGITTPPEFAANNVQDETNIHNLKMFSGLLNADNLFFVFWVVFAALIPLAALSAPVRHRLAKLLPILPAAIAVAFLFNELFAKITAGLVRNSPELYRSTLFPVAHTVFEIKETIMETLLAVGFALLYRNVIRASATRPENLESASAQSPASASAKVATHRKR